MAQRILGRGVCQAAHKVDVEEVVEGALSAAAVGVCSSRRGKCSRLGAAVCAEPARSKQKRKTTAKPPLPYAPDSSSGFARMGRDSIFVMSMSRRANTLSALNSIPGPCRQRRQADRGQGAGHVLAGCV